jgi:hypothetical protein
MARNQQIVENDIVVRRPAYPHATSTDVMDAG